jgi:hypothetical protein
MALTTCFFYFKCNDKRPVFFQTFTAASSVAMPSAKETPTQAPGTVPASTPDTTQPGSTKARIPLMKMVHMTSGRTGFDSASKPTPTKEEEPK